MASLFGRNRLRERAEKIETSEVVDHIAVVQTWLDDYDHGTLKKDKEISRAPRYNADFFMKILGYKDKPATPHTFEAEHTTSAGQFPDGTLRYTDASVDLDRVFAVVELKGAAISLDRPQQRAGNLSPVQQAFKYKPQYSSCPFVVVSNFFEFRLYNDNQLDYEVWTLRDLVDPADDYLKFKQWYVLLHADNMVAVDGKSATERLLSDIRQKQEEIGKQFYADYKKARTALLQDIWRKNEKTRPQFGLAIQKAQTIIDRIVFACFAEDCGLLPDDTLARVGANAKLSPYNDSLWEELKDFFSKVDRGSSKLGIPHGYGGGLFAHDPMVDALEISDEPLEMLVAFGGYNFAEDLRVNILGQIFEQSITDLEEIKRRTWADSQSLDIEEVDPGTGKRKKEGVYYTPDYIVRFIVQNTVGAYLLQKENELKAKHRLTGRLGERGYEERQILAYTEYQYVLQNIKVLDPACGSGAFLVMVFDYLLAENKRVDDILGGNLTSLDDFVRNILSDNIFGVDINEESVEITKLSLWLKTAEKGKALASLDANIRCGNSLISDPAHGDGKDFAWQKEFPAIFNTRGFDVIVGNPPYVNARLMKTEDRAHLLEVYPQLTGSYDLYTAFLLRGHDLLKDGGYYGWIIPNKYLIADYARPTYELMSKESLTTIVNVSTLPVFDGVGVYPIIIMGHMSKEKESVDRYKIFEADHLASVTQFPDLDSGLKRFKTLGDYGIRINSGTTGFEAQVVKGLLNEDGTGIPFAVSGSIDPYQIDTSRVPYMKSVFTHPHIAANLQEISASKYAFWNASKIVIAGMTKRVEAVYVDHPLALGVGVYGIFDFGGINPLALTAILNSSFVSFYLRTEFADKHLAGGYLAINKSTIEQLPLCRVTKKDQEALAELCLRVTASIDGLKTRSGHALQVIESEYGDVNRRARKMKRWWTLDFAEFIKVAKLKLSLKQKDDLLAYFQSVSTECIDLEKSGAEAQQEIDEIIFRMYRVTDEERALVEHVENEV